MGVRSGLEHRDVLIFLMPNECSEDVCWVTGEPTGRIVTAAVGDCCFGTLVTALQGAALDRALAGTERNVTVCSPTNVVFAPLGDAAHNLAEIRLQGCG